MVIEFKNYTSLSLAEHQELLALRNSEVIKKEMFTQEKISLKQHLDFVSSLNKNKQKIYYALYFDTHFVGGINASNTQDTKWEWGVFFDPDSHFIAKSFAVYTFLQHLFTTIKSTSIEAKIKQENQKALQFNKNFGFEFIEQSKGYLLYELTQQKLDTNKNIQALQRYKSRFEIIFC